jgi:hypothetical protein
VQDAAGMKVVASVAGGLTDKGTEHPGLARGRGAETIGGEDQAVPFPEQLLRAGVGHRRRIDRASANSRADEISTPT